MIRKLVLTAFIAAVLAAVGCGSDDTTTPNPGPVVDVRNGTWTLGFEVSYTGSDSCIALGDSSMTFPDTLLCAMDLVGDAVYNFDCTSSIEGESVSFDCNAVIRDLDPCRIIGRIVGSGTITDTTIDMTATVSESLVGDDQVCDLYTELVNRCAQVVHITGQWLSDEDAENCPEADLNKGSVVRMLMSRVAEMSYTGD